MRDGARHVADGTGELRDDVLVFSESVGRYYAEESAGDFLADIYLVGIQNYRTNNETHATAEQYGYINKVGVEVLDWVNHDGNTNRVGGVNVAMEQAPWELLREVVLYDMDGTKDRYDLRLPSLENYITICKRYEKICVLELKSQFTLEETQKIIELIEKYDYLASVIFISFHYSDLEHVKALRPEQTCQFLTGDNSDALIAKLKDAGMDIDIHHPALTEERVGAMHAAGLKVNCWTVDDPARGEELASWGVDFITSNILEGKNE